MRQLREVVVGVLTTCIVVALCVGAAQVWQVPTIFGGDSNPYLASLEVADSTTSLPDFSRYRELRTLTEDEFPIDDATRRTIIIGDVHGMIGPLRKLLRQVNYQPSRDVLIHSGDIITRGPLKGSLAVLDFLTAHNVAGVRGNNDQKTVEWRNWFHWIMSQAGGRRWLERLEAKWEDVQDAEPPKDLEDFLESEKARSRGQEKRWWQSIPKDWEPLGTHYLVARAMSSKHMRYLLDLPLRLHAPHAHTFVVHAGLLASDPKLDLTNSKQPLARIPRIPGSKRKPTVQQLREAQEAKILTDIAQNRDPWTPLNLRSIVKGKLSRSAKDGKYWVKVWNKQMKSCSGFDVDGSSVEFKNQADDFTIQARGRKDRLTLPCYPASVVYGHTASKGLDVKRWSYGLDSGCVYGRRLSALIIGGADGDFGAPAPTRIDEDDDIDDEDDEVGDGEYDHTLKALRRKTITFGDRSMARFASVKC